LVVSMLVLVGVVAAVGERAARADEPDRALLLSPGLGYSFPSSNANGSGDGGWGEIEYVFRPSRAFSPRIYSGVVITNPKNDCDAADTPCNVSAHVFFAGVKARLMIPIPYFGPFLEIGIGASLGEITTQIGQKESHSGSGAMYHIPWALGVAFGARHQYAVSFQYLVHPPQRQFDGAFALGFEIPLGATP
jgi:hypothetical protein